MAGINDLDPATFKSVVAALDVAIKRVAESRSKRHARYGRHAVGTISAARLDLIELLQSGEVIECQDALAHRWHVNPATASRWLAQIEREGHVIRRRDGQRWELSAAKVGERSIIDAGNAEH